jgi:HSP20 family molecular chaperone IbpA
MEQNTFNKQNKHYENGNGNGNFQKPNKEIAREKHYDVFDPFFDGFFRFPSFKNEFKDIDNTMKTDVREEENGYSLEIEMPGVKKENINLELNNGYLTIEAKQVSNDDEKDKNGKYIRRERYYGSCARSFYVGDISEEDISASLDAGILKVHIPKEKKEETKKRIEIK